MLAWRCALRFCASFLLVAASCTPVSESYQIHSEDLTCDEANRAVYAAIEDMGLTVTSLEPARPGHPGKIEAAGSEQGNPGGEVTIRCEADGVHIEANEAGVGGGHEFERGIFLSVTGRTGLVSEGGRLRRRKPAVKPQAATAAKGAREARRRSRGTVRLALEPIRGFATILDFEADLSAVGVLPVKVLVANESARTYRMDPSDIVLRAAGTRRRVRALSPQVVVERLRRAKARAGEQDGIGDIDTAVRLVVDRALRPAKLRPGARLEGFLYFDTGLYDRARVTLTDVATGELEGFLVEF